MRNDALDRFGTRLEKRFTREEVIAVMVAAGLDGIKVSDSAPFWCAVGYHQRPSQPGSTSNREVR